MMTCEPRRDAAEQVEEAQVSEPQDRLVPRGGLMTSLLRGLFWPLGLVVKTYRGFCWVLGFRSQEPAAVLSPARQTSAGRKRLGPVTRLLLHILPRWLQGTLGYPVSSDIGRSLTPEVRVSPIKPCGKGSKRKQDELEDEDEDDQPTWVEALTQELEDEDPEDDPDYEPSSVETESGEFRSQNNTDSDIEVQGSGLVVIQDVSLEVASAPDAVAAV